MSVNYTRNQPVAADDLEVSQPFLYDNTNAADTIFGYDHYAFSDNADGNEGLHKKVTTVPQGSVPTTLTDPILYAYEQYAAVGPIQYSKGVNDAVPTPITSIQSSTPFTLSPGVPVTIMNFTGISFAFCYLSAYGLGSGLLLSTYDQFIWNGSSFKQSNILGTVTFSASTSGSNIILSATGTSKTGVRWILEFKRIE